MRLDGDDFIGEGLWGLFLCRGGRGGLGKSLRGEEEAGCAEKNELWHHGRIVRGGLLLARALVVPRSQNRDLGHPALVVSRSRPPQRRRPVVGVSGNRDRGHLVSTSVVPRSQSRDLGHPAW